MQVAGLRFPARLAHTAITAAGLTALLVRIPANPQSPH